MNVILFQKVIDCTGYLSLEVVESNHGSCSFIFQNISVALYIRHNDVSYILYHCLLVGPMLRRMGHMPICWESILWMTASCLTFINKLYRKEITCDRSTKNSCNLLLIIFSTRFASCCSIVQSDDGTILMPV